MSEDGKVQYIIMSKILRKKLEALSNAEWRKQPQPRLRGVKTATKGTKGTNFVTSGDYTVPWNGVTQLISDIQ